MFPKQIRDLQRLSPLDKDQQFSYSIYRFIKAPRQKPIGNYGKALEERNPNLEGKKVKDAWKERASFFVALRE